MWNDFVFKTGKTSAPVIPTTEHTHPDVSSGTSKLDPMLDIGKKVANKVQYEGEEQGIYHPLYHQMIKLRNNQMLDIFADKDNGIRMDPHTQSINFFTNEYKLHIRNYTAWIKGYHKRHIHGDELSKVHGQYWLHAYGTVGFVAEKEWKQEVKGNQKNLVYKDDSQTVDGNQTITVGKNQTIVVKGNVTMEVHGSLTATVNGDASINAKKNVNIKAGGNATIEAGGTLAAKAKTIDLHGDVNVKGRFTAESKAFFDDGLSTRTSALVRFKNFEVTEKTNLKGVAKANDKKIKTE